MLIAADIATQYQWGCTLRFALWTGEEYGLLGASAYAQRAFNRGENIVGVLNLDMIGYNTIGSNPDIELHANSSIPSTLAVGAAVRRRGRRVRSQSDPPDHPQRHRRQ